MFFRLCSNNKDMGLDPVFAVYFVFDHAVIRKKKGASESG